MIEYLELLKKKAIGKTFIDADTDEEYEIVAVGEYFCGKIKLIIREIGNEKLAERWFCESSLACIIGEGLS